jgi:hypothetical protein
MPNSFRRVSISFPRHAGRAVPVRVSDCSPNGLLKALVYIDLVGKDEGAALETLLKGVDKGGCVSLRATRLKHYPRVE